MDTWETIEGDYRLLWPYKGKITAEVSDGEVYWKISTEPPNEIRAYVFKEWERYAKKDLTEDLSDSNYPDVNAYGIGCMKGKRFTACKRTSLSGRKEYHVWHIFERDEELKHIETWKKLIISIIKGEVQPEQDILVKYHGKYYKSYSSKNQDA